MNLSAIRTPGINNHWVIYEDGVDIFSCNFRFLTEETVIAEFLAMTEKSDWKEVAAEFAEYRATRDRTPIQPESEPRRILGYTVISRVEAALGPDLSKLAITAIQETDPAGYARLLSSPHGVLVDDKRLVAGLASLGLDPDIILAP